MNIGCCWANHTEKEENINSKIRVILDTDITDIATVMNSEIISQKTLTQQIIDIGVSSDVVLLVHCAFSNVKSVENGPAGLITALLGVLGSEGTLVMPSMSDEYDAPFDVAATPCLGMGVMADTFWRLPNGARSDNPHAFAAQGAQAVQITAPHPLDIPHSLASPVGRIYELDGQILLIGVGHDANTTIHLAEHLAGVRYRREKQLSYLNNGQLTWLNYLEIDHCCQNFHLVDEWLDVENLQRRGKIGHAEARLMNSRDEVRLVTKQLKIEETVFLHPIGFDEECDEARASIELKP